MSLFLARYPRKTLLVNVFVVHVLPFAEQTGPPAPNYQKGFQRPRLPHQSRAALMCMMSTEVGIYVTVNEGAKFLVDGNCDKLTLKFTCPMCLK